MDSTTKPSAGPPPPQDAAGNARLPRPRIASAELFRGARELVIDHRGEEYRLKLTRHDKLILNK